MDMGHSTYNKYQINVNNGDETMKAGLSWHVIVMMPWNGTEAVFGIAFLECLRGRGQ